MAEATEQVDIKAQILREKIRIEQSRIKNVDSSPIKLEDQKISAFGRRFNSMDELEADPMYKQYPDTYVTKYPTDEEIESAKRGVDTRTGSSVGRMKQGFMPDDDKATFIKRQLENKFGTDTQVRKVGSNIEFVNPETNRWTTFDEYGFSINDVKDMFGEGIVFVGDVIGSIGGFALGGPQDRDWETLTRS